MQRQLQNTLKPIQICIFSAFSLLKSILWRKKKGQNIWVYHTAEEMAANCFHNHCQCNYIIVIGIGVTWHSRMSNASKGCQINRVLSSYSGPGRRCINAMWQYQIGCLHSLWYPSLCLPSLQRSDPPRPLQNAWTREGLNPPRGGGGAVHVKGSLQPETFEVIDHCLFPKTAPNTWLKESQLQLAS